MRLIKKTESRKYVCFVIAGAVIATLYLALSQVSGAAAVDLDQASGLNSVGLILVIAASTLISEDLTCIAAGVLVAQGQISFALGAFACFAGIFAGDVLLFLAGRYLGRPVLDRGPLRWLLRREDVERSSLWFNRRGIAVIAISRFVPGMRLPTYFAAGLLNTDLRRFSIYFLVAALVWTPLLVGLSSVLGEEAINSALLEGRSAFVQATGAGLIVLMIARLATGLSTHRGRRLLVSRWRRLVRWEFWPLWIFYVPVVCYVLRLAIKHRSLTVFTAANPSIPAGGFIGESKSDILGGLSKSNGYVARFEVIEASRAKEERIAQAASFMALNNLSFPVVLKPDRGQRGTEVEVVRSAAHLQAYLERAGGDTIVQEYVPGCEFGVFYIRLPDEGRGRVFSITEKRFPEVVGDGRRTLERLILDDPRAVCMARRHLENHRESLMNVPDEGQRVRLVEIGTHCRGAMFLDGEWAKTAELENAVDELSRRFDGFYFGRYDLRAASVGEFKAGRFKVIELNGVTSEATNIYDPKNSLVDAYRVLFEQWRLAFEIGAKNRERGARASTLRESITMLFDYHRGAFARPLPVR